VVCELEDCEIEGRSGESWSGEGEGEGYLSRLLQVPQLEREDNNEGIKGMEITYGST